MKAIIRKVYMKHVETKAGKKFDKVCIECDVIMADSTVRTRTAEMSVDYAKKYFAYCGYTSAELIGKECDVTMQKRAFDDANGVTRTFEEIKYLNMLDPETGERIIMREKASSDLPF